MFDDRFAFGDLFTFHPACLFKKNDNNNNKPPPPNPVDFILSFGAFAACKGVTLQHWNRKSLIRSESTRLNMKESETQKEPLGS